MGGDNLLHARKAKPSESRGLHLALGPGAARRLVRYALPIRTPTLKPTNENRL